MIGKKYLKMFNYTFLAVLLLVTYRIAISLLLPLSRKQVLISFFQIPLTHLPKMFVNDGVPTDYLKL